MTNRAALSVRDIEDNCHWKAMFALLRAVYSALLLLRLCNKNTPAMDMLYYRVHRTTLAIEKSMESLNDKGLFHHNTGQGQELAEEANEVYGDSDGEESGGSE